MDTIGSLIDKMSINELKVYHVREKLSNDEISEDEILDCEHRLSILETQREDLKNELQQLMDGVLSGNSQMKVYRQLKMYKEKRRK